MPINNLLLKTLKSLKYLNSDGFVFINNKGKPIKDVRTAFDGALKRSGIKKFTFHDLRHTFASNLVMNGVDPVTVKELMGHSSIQMTMRYSHPTPEHKVQAVESLDAGFTGQETVKNGGSMNSENSSTTNKH